MKIFVSYSRRDAGNYAEKIYVELENEGHQVFTDIYSIRMGEIWSDTINSNISKCDVFVIIVTPAALKSLNVENEVLHAQRERKRIIPCFHKFVSKVDLKWGLDKIQGIDFEDKYDLTINILFYIQEGKPKEKEDQSSIKMNLSVHKESANVTTGVPLSKPKEWYLKRAKDFREIELYTKAEEMYDIVIKLDPDDPNAWVDKANCLIKMGKYEDAIKACDKAIDINPKDATAWNNSGWSLHNLKRYTKALENYEISLKINPGNDLAWNNKGISLQMLGRQKEAMVAYDKAIEINPCNDLAWNNKGISLYMREIYDEAIDAFNKAIEINTNYANPWYMKGESLHMLGRFVDAVEAYDKYIEINPGYADAWYSKGICLTNRGRHVEALEAYDKAKECGFQE